MLTKDFNVQKETEGVIQWIKDYFDAQPHATGAILGVSGGKDSSVVAALLVKALGKERVFGVMMPNGLQKDIEDSFKIADFLDIAYRVVDIAAAYKGIVADIEGDEGNFTLSKQALINIAPRLRMTTLYAVAQSLGSYRVIGTGNRSETYVGYFTKYGDGGVDMNPIANYTSDEVVAIGDYLGLPYELTHKTPSDGLSGKSDEESLGFTYDQLNAFIQIGTSGDVNIDKEIAKKHHYNQHKLQPIAVYKR